MSGSRPLGSNPPETTAPARSSFWATATSAEAAERAFAEVLRHSRVVDWIYGSVVLLSLILLTLQLAKPHLYAAPRLGAVIASGVILTGLVLPRTQIGRSAYGVVGFFLLTYIIVVMVSHSNGLGIRTPALSVGPVFLFITACLAPTRVAVGMVLVALAMMFSVVPASQEALGARVPTLGAEVISAALSLTLSGILGVAIGRVLRQAVATATEATQSHYRTVYGEQNLRTLRAVVEASPYAIVMAEMPGGKILLFNEAFAQVMGRSPAEIEGQTGPSLDGWADLAQRSRILGRVLAGEVVEEDIGVRRRDGSVRTLRACATAVEVDQVRHLLLVGHDVSDQWQRQAELQAVIDTAEAAIVVLRKGHILLASRRYEELMRVPPPGAAGQSADPDVGGAEQARQLYERHGPALRAGELISLEHTVHRRDGSTFEARITGRLLHPGGDDGFTLVFLLEDVTAAKAYQRQLEKAREDALSASRAKSEFLAVMSHEIRTPLNGVLGLAELAVDPQLDEASRLDHLRLILESGRSLAQVLSDVLDISKIEAGRLALQPESFDLGPWLEGIRSSFALSAKSKGLELRLQAPETGLGWVHADPIRLRQILVNYLSNAVKFTFQGQITLRLSRPQPDRLRMEVTDTGMGVDEAAQARLFQPFEQTSLGARQAGASGLGLSICRELAHHMGGAVGVSSEPGHGSTFWAEVQVKPVEPHAVPAPQPTTERPLEGLRILLADDNPINQLVGKRLLQRAGAEVQTADDGLQAVEAVERALAQGEPFDVVLMDVQMPVMDGVAATRELRSRPAGRGLLIVAATAAALQEDLDDALAQGMDAAITKPFESAKMVATVQQGLRRLRAHLPH